MGLDSSALMHRAGNPWERPWRKRLLLFATTMRRGRRLKPRICQRVISGGNFRTRNGKRLNLLEFPTGPDSSPGSQQKQ